MQGLKPDEVLEVNLKLPSAPGASSEAMESNDKDSSASTSKQTSGQAQGTGGALLGKQRPGLGGLGTLLPRPRFAGPASPLLAPLNPSAPGTDPQSGSTASDGGHFVLRCGNLLMSAEVEHIQAVPSTMLPCLDLEESRKLRCSTVAAAACMTAISTPNALDR